MAGSKSYKKYITPSTNRYVIILYCILKVIEKQMQKFINFIISLIILSSATVATTTYAYAAGMAVTLSNIALVNNTNSPISMAIPNIADNARVSIAANSSCKLDTSVMFIPNMIKGDSNFYILLKVHNEFNPIMIFPINHLELASKVKISKAYSKLADQFSLFAICGGSNDIWQAPIHTIVVDNKTQPPSMVPHRCTKGYLYFYVYGKVPDPKVLIKPMPICKINM